MKIAVYCSAKDSIPEEYKQVGREIGTWLALSGHDLVYGGATGGLMTQVSEAFKEAKTNSQKIIGVVPPRIKAAKRLATNCDELIEVPNMAERKHTMRQIADCFIVLPGSYGTLDELFDVVASGTVNEHKKHIFVLNYNGFFNGLLTLIEHMKELTFLPQDECYKPHFATSVEALQEKINTRYKLN